MRKAAALILVSLLIIVGLQHIALADSPAPDLTITIAVDHAPADAAYIDILVEDNIPEINKTNPDPLIPEKYPALAKSELYGYENGGYISYSLYYSKQVNNQSDQNDDMKFPAFGGNKFCGVLTMNINSIKIVLLNSAGKILRVSDAISLTANDNMHDFLTPKVDYDYSTNKTQVHLPIASGESGAFLVIILVFGALIRVTVSTGIEVIIALPFKIEPLRVIVIANIITQIIVSVGIPIMTIFEPYAISVLVFEALVYLLEFAAYMKFTKEPKWSRVLLYTVAANTASLLIGLLLNSWGLFWG